MAFSKRGKIMSSQEHGVQGSSVAWFKLADLVMRKEREKAMNVYRLLSHSFDDRAYALQVEGDLLWHFEDKKYFKKYEEAALLYQKERRWLSAVAVYEHINELAPSVQYLMMLFRYYVLLKRADKCEQSFISIKKSLENKEIDEIDIINVVKTMIDTDGLNKDAILRKWLWKTGDSFFQGLEPSTYEQIERLLK